MGVIGSHRGVQGHMGLTWGQNGLRDITLIVVDRKRANNLETD